MKKNYSAPTTTIYNVKAQAVLQAVSPQIETTSAVTGAGYNGGDNFAAEYEELEDY